MKTEDKEKEAVTPNGGRGRKTIQTELLQTKGDCSEKTQHSTLNQHHMQPHRTQNANHQAPGAQLNSRPPSPHPCLRPSPSSSQRLPCPRAPLSVHAPPATQFGALSSRCAVGRQVLGILPIGGSPHQRSRERRREAGSVVQVA